MAAVHGCLLHHHAHLADLPRRKKPDRTMVSAADEESEALLLPALRALTPAAGIVSEESFAEDSAAHAQGCWLVDPLDGTNGFLHGSDEFVVLLAYVVEGVAVWGMIGHPPSGKVVWGDAEIRTIMHTVLSGASHAEPKPLWQPDDAEGAALPAAEVAQRLQVHAAQGYVSGGESADSVRAHKLMHGLEESFHFQSLHSGLKFLRMVEGYGTSYFRTRPCSAWDIAAGAALLTAIGGEVLDGEGEPMVFPTTGSMLCTGGFFARVSKHTAARYSS